MRVSLAVSHPRGSRRFDRLVGKDEFEKVFRAGRKRVGRYFAIYSLREIEGVSRLGMVVPKRLVGTSVRRNEVKRLVRECFRMSLSANLNIAMIVRLQRGYAVGERKVAGCELGALMEAATL